MSIQIVARVHGSVVIARDLRLEFELNFNEEADNVKILCEVLCKIVKDVKEAVCRTERLELPAVWRTEGAELPRV